jgi:hypothetical protein
MSACVASEKLPWVSLVSVLDLRDTMYSYTLIVDA